MPDPDAEQDLNDVLGISDPSELFEDGASPLSDFDADDIPDGLMEQVNREVFEGIRDFAPNTLSHLELFRQKLIRDAKQCYNDGWPRDAKALVDCAEDIQRDIEFVRHLVSLVLLYLREEIEGGDRE